jgi:uncharacterized protein (TIGR02421 family)
VSEAKRKTPAVTDRSIGLIAKRLTEGKRVRRTLPEGGRLHVDRPLPFLCVYRRPARRTDAGTDRLITTEPSYLIAPAAGAFRPQLTALVRGLAQPIIEEFGAFLLLEVWSGPAADNQEAHQDGPTAPRFRIVAPRGEEPGDFLDEFRASLSRVRVRRQRARVSVRHGSVKPSQGTTPILSRAEAAELGCTVLGLEVAPIYRNADTGEIYPLVLRELRRSLSRALRRGFYEFTRKRTTHKPRHFHMLGRKAVVRAVWTVDAGLADVADRFDFLLQVTPVNAAAAWQEFARKRYESEPTFHYRPLEIDPVVLKRTLYEVPVERIEDPTLAFLFREKLDEIDRQITMMHDLNTRRFVHGSMQLFGDVDETLVGLAEQLLERVPARARDDSRGGHMDATAFAARAREEIAYYRAQWPQVNAAVEIRSDVPAGLMVSRGSLLVGDGSRIPQARVRALLCHEIGTHVLTYYNGRAQPFRQLYLGLAGYEALQEGLAVLSEYLVGGLSRPRLRLLAARVVAVRRMIDGASFLETFAELIDQYGFDRRTSFVVTMRVFRGGGFTKDAVYLRGLRDVLFYLKGGGELDSLFVGKIATEHVNLVRELKWRGVLRESPLRPRYLDDKASVARLEHVCSGVTVLDLVKEARR